MDSAGAVARAVGAALDDPVRAASEVRGGDVAEAFRLDLASGRTVFAKTHRRAPPGAFATEAWGLAWLRDAEALPVPEVLHVADREPGTDALPLLVLAWIDVDGRAMPDEAAFGRALAGLHAAGAPCFGREDRRPTGSRGLPNDPAPSWASFLAERRLLPLARLVRDDASMGGARHELATGLEDVASRLDELLGSPEPPARLHGDLWAGNRVVDRDGRSWLVDPACFGGHREHDLALMRLFGGFGGAAFAAYAEAAPLTDGWEGRVALHQLAPLAVHAVKLGGAYVPALGRALASLGA